MRRPEVIVLAAEVQRLREENAAMRRDLARFRSEAVPNAALPDISAPVVKRGAATRSIWDHGAEIQDHEEAPWR